MREPGADGGAVTGFEPAIDGPTQMAPDALVFAFDERRLLVTDRPAGEGEGAGACRLPSVEELATIGEDPAEPLFLGRASGREVWAVALRARTPPASREAFRLRGLRALFGRLDETHFWLAARAVQIVDWDRDHRYCGRCGRETARRVGDRSRRCEACGQDHYPRLAPAVIVLVHDGDRVLLARSPHFPSGMYSTLAGFVEPGESLEETVAREIREEVGVAVSNLRYFGSQPWPFPHSLMVGFHAAWAGGELRFDPSQGEIEDASWFPIGALPQIPPRISIARALIDAYRDMVGLDHR